MSHLQEALSTLAPARLQGIRRGIEKESLRATPTGALALTPHPTALGSALTHPNITTDYSESQLELITGVHGSVEQCLENHATSTSRYRALGDELMWRAACGVLPADETSRSAATVRPNVDRARALYRMGLAHATAGPADDLRHHYNWSLPGVSDPGTSA